MKSDEFSFFNQQLAAMVRDGIPLETALRRLCSDMRHGQLRAELEKLETDLAKGTPLREAVAARQLPDLYRQMLEVGAQSNNLPAVLTMLADHYQRRHVVWTRLKGLMVYPMIVFVGAFLLSCLGAVLLTEVLRTIVWPGYHGAYAGQAIYIVLWFAPVFLAVVGLALSIAVSLPAIRRGLRWRLPAFKEASLAQVASALALMLKSGVPLDNALALLERMERGTPAATEFALWRQRLASGLGKFPELTAHGRFFPPLFVWTVSQAHEDLAAGFQSAADTYQSRANYRTELLLYSALPCSVLALGMLIIIQLQPVIALFAQFMDTVAE
jgi:type II secretory pathway component PulF